METAPTPAGTHETSDFQAAKRATTASNDSFSHPKKYARSQTEATTPKLHLKIHS
jgi:hypothetical protein